MFDHIDKGHRGFIEISEFSTTVRKMLPFISGRILADLTRLLDEDGKGKVDKGEFTRFLQIESQPHAKDNDKSSDTVMKTPRKKEPDFDPFSPITSRIEVD